MKWFADLQTRSKLVLGFGLMIALLAVVIATAYRSITTMQQSLESLAQVEFNNVSDLKDLQSNQHLIRGNSASALITTDRSAQEKLLNDGDERTQKNDEFMRRLLQREKNPEHRAKLEEYETVRKTFRETREKQVVPLIYGGKIEVAKDIITGIQADRNQKMEAIVADLVREAEKEAQKALTYSEKVAGDSARVLAVVGAMALLLAATATMLLNRMIAAPLIEISRAAEQIVTGDLTVHISLDHRGDEVGALAGAFRKMVENLRDVNKEIVDGVTILASSATEIMTSTAQLASSATETAAAVNETTTTVEEVKQTAQLSDQKAKYVLESARKSAQVSQIGEQSVEETIQVMNRIREQMGSIAESIVRLSDQSQAIGEIIATVNDLAEQSNLLAVNAAIEAAKAGEQGKGFAVVAQEIKSLAQQSRQATSQVRTILGDIQKATSAAVMATEQGSKAVEAGVKQAAETGESIRLLTDSLAESGQTATQIVASSQQQVVGTDQVALAMANVKLASEQTAESTRQTEAVARNLHLLGQNLKGLVDHYKI
jgi:methyl-accepting chemotaxis protein